MIERRWVVAFIIGNQERKFSEWMAEREINCYLPLAKRKTKPRQKQKAILKEVPAFPNYVFVNIKLGHFRNREWGILRQAPGFVRLVTENGGLPLLVPDATIRALWDEQQKGSFDHREFYLSFVRGTAVEIKSSVLGQAYKGQVLSDPDKALEFPTIEVQGRKIKIHVSLMEISGHYANLG